MAWKGTKPTDFILQVTKDAEKLVKDIAIDTIQMLATQSPVDTGAYRFSHIVSINSPDYSHKEINGDPVPTALSKIVGFQLGSVIYIQNNSPYAGVIEFGGYPNPPKKGSWNKKAKRYEIKSSGGYSMQAPKGVYTVTFNYIVQKYGG